MEPYQGDWEVQVLRRRRQQRHSELQKNSLALRAFQILPRDQKSCHPRLRHQPLYLSLTWCAQQSSDMEPQFTLRRDTRLSSDH
ncbi:hypothetical protein AVEN_42620-1 [Araneus ventricosus]|uniref:Uncharacterized protein n=1 Tax=Araneus ventricosus TaxID=182803 RepID=A0A4Y2SF03_ARAVE|nr:hypothetical protein AVEN_42620-1 [Araneus ventricosus]